MTRPPSDRPFRHLRPEADKRDAMTDDEFWAHVFPQPEEDAYFADDEVSLTDSGECPICGEFGACAFDAEGQAMVHVVAYEEES